MERRVFLSETRLRLLSTPHSTHRAGYKRCRGCKPVAVGWDPEGILAQPRGGHISRQQTRKTLTEDAELQRQYDQAREEAAAELRKKREERIMPTSHSEVVEFLLSTNAEEMQFETTRCRPLLTPEFFEYLGEQIGKERFAARPDDARVAELQGLRDFASQAVQDLDKKMEGLAAPRERVMKLLQAQDKKGMLLQMQGDNEIDDSLLQLLQQNADSAAAAGQQQAAEFMIKLKNAARKYMLV